MGTLPVTAPTSLRPGLSSSTQTPQTPAETIRTLAAQFESLLIGQMLKDMQKSTFDPSQQGLFGGALTDTLFTEVANSLSRSGGMGLADALAGAFARAAGVDTPVAVPVAGVTAPSLVRVSAGMDHVDRQRMGSAYGWRTDPISGADRFHHGVDIPLVHGEEIRSAQAGTIVEAGASGGYGINVVIDHGGGVRSRYAHLSAADVAVGDVVPAGQAIGRAGRTGRATGVHLHFEVLAGGRSIDPTGAEAARLLGERPTIQQSSDAADYADSAAARASHPPQR